MSSKYWIKLYHEILDDPKMGRLPDNIWRRCIELFLMAGELDNNGRLPNIDDIGWKLRVDPDELQSEINQLEQVGVLSKDEDGLYVTKFEIRQRTKSGTERSRLSRERNKNTQRTVALDATDEKTRETWRTKIYKNLPQSPGVYAIKCAGSNKLYIGASINISTRVKAHLSEMGSSPHHKMNDDFREYGPESIYVEVLEHVTDESLLKNREHHWISQYPIDGLYNTEPHGKRHRDWRNEDATIRCTDKDKDKDKEQLHGAGGRQFTDEDFGNVCQQYETEIGLLSPVISDEVKSALGLFPVVWLIDAITEAAKANKRQWRYIAGILRNWEAKGRDSPKNNDVTKAYTPQPILNNKGEVVGTL